MALVSEDELNDAVYSLSITEKTTTVTSSPSLSLPTLPFDLIPEILSRLPVKLLLQFRCVCKSWNSLISDPNFAKKHLTLSTTYNLHCLTYRYKYFLDHYSLDDHLYFDVTTIDVAKPQFSYNDDVYFVGSCNGILCVAHLCYDLFLLHLWNPSLRKFKKLPFLHKPLNNFRRSFTMNMYGFGFDPVSDNYKVVVVLPVFDYISGNYISELKVHTLGTDSWRSITVFSFDGDCFELSGEYVSGTINWLVSMDINKGQCSIASFDLGNESYQEVLLPDYFKVNIVYTHLSVFRDCLCLIYGEDVWVMKEYGNNESWTKLFTISNMRDSLTPAYSYIKAKYVFEDHQVLIESRGGKYIFYNFRNGTSKLVEFENTPEVCVESLISPCF